MSTTLIPRRRLYRLDGEKKPINVEVPIDTYNILKRLADHRGWSVAEATRQAIGILLAQNKDIVDYLYSLSDVDSNGR